MHEKYNTILTFFYLYIKYSINKDILNDFQLEIISTTVLA